MPVLEICHLLIKPPHSPTLPPGSPLLAALQFARSALATRVYNTQSRFFQDISSPSSIYILGIWPSVARHNEFLASPERGAILDSQEEYFAFGGMWHVDIKEKGMECLPLDVSLLRFARSKVPSDKKAEFDGALENANAKSVYGGSAMVLGGWAVDGDADEYFVFWGLEKRGIEEGACKGVEVGGDAGLGWMPVDEWRWLKDVEGGDGRDGG